MMSYSNLKIAGWATVFNTVDDGADMVVPGAFKTELETSRYRSMLLGHDQTQIIGRWDLMEETSFGLWAEGVVFDEHVAYLVVHHALCGLSIGYNARKTCEPRENGIRRLEDINMKEVSITPVPMNREAMIMWTDQWKSGPTKALLKCQVGGSTHASAVNNKDRTFHMDGREYRGDQQLPGESGVIY